MAKFIEILYSGEKVTINTEMITVIKPSRDETMIYLNAKYPNGSGIVFTITEKYNDFIQRLNA